VLTASSSFDDAALVELVHPDLAKTIEVLDDIGAVPPLTFRPGQKVAELLVAQQFSGHAVNPAALAGDAPAAPDGLSNRTVRTSTR
jgi:hypothetical protein